MTTTAPLASGGLFIGPSDLSPQPLDALIFLYPAAGMVNGALARTLVCNRRPRKKNPQQELVRVPGFHSAILSPG